MLDVAWDWQIDWPLEPHYSSDSNLWPNQTWCLTVWQADAKMMKGYVMKWSACSQKQLSVLPRQTSCIFGNAVSCCFQMMWCCFCQRLKTMAPHVSWNLHSHICVCLCACVCVRARVQGCDRGMMLGQRTALLSTPTQSSISMKLWPPKMNTRR